MSALSTARARLPFRWPAVALSLALVTGGTAACSDSTTGPDETIAFLVGDWQAEILLLRNAANPDGVIDLMELGGGFTLNVQPSGHYTATLSLDGLAEPELGTLEVDGDEIVFHRQVPSPETQRATYTYSDDTLTLEGETEVDVNSDGEKESAILEATLVRD